MENLLPRPPTRRAPLGDATSRINNQKYEPEKTSDKSYQRQTHIPLLQPAVPLQYEVQRAESSRQNAANPRLSAISKDTATNSNRSSQISTVSTNASDGQKRKRTIGPWQLGKTLGSGATARVRLARHVNTGQHAAIKIVQKQSAQISQAGSLADLDRLESSKPKPEDGTRRMPVGIEREVAIMKLIQHPNIMRLYDIWENRTEIYLVLEYVDGGELFAAITANGRLSEPEAIKYFQQIIAGVGYCHELHICHRDLKPENILLTKEGQIKIADFGMAALHQSPSHKLKTSCGSPHYAAPEVVNGGAYRGDKTDIWSIGVILYATLAGRLPFDTDATGDDLVRALVPKIKKGVYEMPEDFSPEAADLIWRMLQVDPKDRITMNQIWRHPIVRKYAWLYDCDTPSVSPSVKESGGLSLRRSDISRELLGHLRSLWHRLSEQQIIDALLSPKPNEQKMFYSLLKKYRDTQLENYTPELSFSASDYHHAKEQVLTKTYSTCHFPQPAAKGHTRQTSRFTVVSNAAETERSYDPYKASRPQNLDSMRPAVAARITIHRRRPSAEEAEDSLGEIKMVRKTSRTTCTSVAARKDRGRHQNLALSRVIASRSSMASSTRSRGSGSGVRAPVGHKRAVNFSQRRRRSIGSQTEASANIKPVVSRHSNHTEVTANSGDSLHPAAGDSTSYIKSKKAQPTASQPLLPASKAGRGSQLWTEDVRQLSSSLASDCDAAFNRSDIETKTKATDSLHPTIVLGKSSPLATQPPIMVQKQRLASFDNRPLPPAPPRSESAKNELLEARRQAEMRKELGGDKSSTHLDRMVSHIDRLMQTASTERRTSSAPAESQYNALGWPLPSVHEARRDSNSPRRPTDLDKYLDSQHGLTTSRIASAPEHRDTKKYSDNRFMRSESGMRNTIRVVQPSSPSPVKAPAPLTIRKKNSHGSPPASNAAVSSPDTSRSSSSRKMSPGHETRHQYPDSSRVELGRISEDQDVGDQFGNDSSTSTVIKKKQTWLKRISKLEASNFRVPSESYVHPLLPVPPKKKGFKFGRLFKKKMPDMAIVGTDIDDDDMSTPDSTADFPPRFYNKRSSISSNPAKRQIEPQQNWLAKLFNIKPASEVICFCVSERRARQEIVAILKEWKRYGIRELQVDKKGNRVFGKVAAKNFLDMKEAAFAAEVMKVIEHGRKSNLSIARFTQEFGAASSFHKVVETLEGVLRCRGMLVADNRKRRLMIKTLNSA